MQNLTSTLCRLVVVLTGALALSSCSRAEYAFLPKSASYLGTATAASRAHAIVAAPAIPTVVASSASEVAVVEAPVTGAPTQEVTTSATAVPSAKAVALEAKSIAAASVAVTTATPVATAKPNLVQRLALNKVMRKLDKQTQKIMARRGDNTSSTARGSISGNLRIGIILLLIGLLVSFLNGFIGGIIAVIGLIFVVLWLLDQL